jgi:hypothetical protein
MPPETKALIIKSLRKTPTIAQNVIKEMEAGKKISAIKEVRDAVFTVNRFKLGLLEAKLFVELYYDSDYINGVWHPKVKSSQFVKDLSTKGLKFDEMSEFGSIDIKQISTKALMAFRKKLNKELKSRGKQL